MEALFINGVYEDVLDEILKSQTKNPNKTFYLQPYSAFTITQLKKISPTKNTPLPLYISTTTQLNQICYSAEIIRWENKKEISHKRLVTLNNHISEFQPEEKRIYFEVDGKECINLISIRNIVKLTNHLSTSNLIKEKGREPLKKRSRSGGWSYVYAQPLLIMEKSFLKEYLDSELERNISASLKDNDKLLKKRLSEARKIPEKVQTISYGFRRNSDVITAVLKRSNGKCELCGAAAPFYRASNNTPYLEVHHWKTLAEGGEDTIENAGALCPNCHKRAHFGKEQKFIKSNKALPVAMKKVHD